jgi:hypothetical protein
MRRAPAKSRKYFKDPALIAMDDRIATEILPESPASQRTGSGRCGTRRTGTARPG